jgi:hypothetical protein
MPSSPIPDAARAAAERLAPAAVRAISELRKGGNSRIFRVTTAAGDFALKKYPMTDTRDRQGAEARALAFFARAGIGDAPLFVSADPAERISLLTWIAGGPVGPLTDGDVERFAAFQIHLDAAIDAEARRSIGEASEACLSGGRILEHVARRFSRLDAVKAEVPGLADLVDRDLLPAARHIEDAARRAFAALGLDFDSDLPAGQRTLIASDFGAHNALRRSDGTLAFVDFEYFGWDDPVTSIGNFVLHPGMELSAAQQQLYAARLTAYFGAEVARRSAALLPLFVLRWCGIIVSEILPERWRHRLAANADLDAYDAVCERQIARARRLLADLAAGADVFGR